MKKIVPFIVGVLVIAVIAVLGYFGYTKLSSPNLIDEDKYQAVFLSNGQVYFGKVENLSKQYAQITDIYYLIIKQPLQQQQPAEGEETTQQTPEYSLIKLGEELHGPIDKMTINRDHILFVEDLKDDGKVSKAITDYKAGNK